MVQEEEGSALQSYVKYIHVCHHLLASSTLFNEEEWTLLAQICKHP